MRIEEAGHHRNAGDVNRGVAVTDSRAPRCGCASSANIGVIVPNSAKTVYQPSHDVCASRTSFERPAEKADGRHREAEGDRRPEQPVAAAPAMAAADDHGDAGHRREEQRHEAEPEEAVGIALQHDAGEHVERAVNRAVEKPLHVSDVGPIRAAQ